MIISFWNIAISQISSSKWQCTNEKKKKHALLYNQQTGWGSSVHFNIWIRFYPEGDMITGTKAGDGQYARTDYTGACVFDNKKLIFTCMSCGSEDALGFSCSDPLMCVCVWIIEEKPEVSEVARGLYIPCPEHYKNYCVHGDCEYPNMLSTPSCRYTHTLMMCLIIQAYPV